jgi:hypothetical protein
MGREEGYWGVANGMSDGFVEDCGDIEIWREE